MNIIGTDISGRRTVHLAQKEVFVMDNEPIIGQDGSTKNDCERNAAKRLLSSMQESYGKEWLVFVMDALNIPLIHSHNRL